MSSPILSHFRFVDGPETARSAALLYRELAYQLDRMVPDSAEKTVALRKLLESRDAYLRCCAPPEAPEPHPIEGRGPPPSQDPPAQGPSSFFAANPPGDSSA